MNKATKSILIALAGLLAAVMLASAAALLILEVRTEELKEDAAPMLADEKYQKAVSVEGVEVITQDVSCGYAVMEMFSKWSGHDVTEKSLYEEYGRVVTSTGEAFAEEMNKHFPEYTTEIRKYQKDTELLKAVYEQLARGVPVPVEWAAKSGEEWTLHYSLVTGMDLPGDKVTVANPYGYVEEITVTEFLERTRYDAYEKMPLILKLGFAFGVFEKNTVFVIH